MSGLWRLTWGLCGRRRTRSSSLYWWPGMRWRLCQRPRPRRVLRRKSLQSDSPLSGAGFCAGLFWASSAILGAESAWNIFVTGVDWYKDGGGCARGMSGSRIVGLKLGDGRVSADSCRTGATTGLFRPLAWCGGLPWFRSLDLDLPSGFHSFYSKG